MKSGMSVNALAEEITRRNEVSKDYLAHSSMLNFTNDNGIRLNIQNEYSFNINNVAHEQIATKLDIPKRYYDRMLETDSDLLVHNVNTWLNKDDSSRMVRTLDNTARAFLSNSYRPIDNILIAEAALPVLSEIPDLQILSCEITERRMYLSVVTPKIQGEVAKNDIVQMGLTISNSEVGYGNVRIEPLIYRLVCLNGMIRSHTMKRRHVGTRLNTYDEVISLESFYKNDTLQISNKALMLQVRDTVKHSFDEMKFQEELTKFKEANETKIENKDIVAFVKEVTKKFVIPKNEGDGILTHLISGGNLSKWGLANAVTALANDDYVNYDRAYELQKIGGAIIELSPKEWKVINK